MQAEKGDELQQNRASCSSQHLSSGSRCLAGVKHALVSGLAAAGFCQNAQDALIAAVVKWLALPIRDQVGRSSVTLYAVIGLARRFWADRAKRYPSPLKTLGEAKAPGHSKLASDNSRHAENLQDCKPIRAPAKDGSRATTNADRSH